MPLGTLLNLPPQPGTLGFVVENAIVGAPLKREYVVSPTSTQILPGDPVTQLTSGLIRRSLPTDTAILGFAAEFSSFERFMGGQFPFAPVYTENRLQANDQSSNKRITVYVADGQNTFTAKIKGSPSASNAGGTFDLGFACTGIQPTVAVQGTAGAVSYSYKVVPVTTVGPANQSAGAGTTATGNATLTAANFNRITWAAQFYAVEYEVWKLVGATYELLGTVPAGSPLQFDDTGIATSAARPIPATSVNRSGFTVDVDASVVDVIQFIGHNLRGVETMVQGTLAKFSVPMAASQYLGAARAAS